MVKFLSLGGKFFDDSGSFFGVPTEPGVFDAFSRHKSIRLLMNVTNKTNAKEFTLHLVNCPVYCATNPCFPCHDGGVIEPRWKVEYGTPDY